MAACEKCWRDAGGRAYEYMRLIELRKGNPCTPEQQAGPDATECPTCKRHTVHQYAHVCMICGYRRPRRYVPDELDHERDYECGRRSTPMVTEKEVFEALKDHGVKVELGAQYSVRGQFAQIHNAVEEIVSKHQKEATQ